MGQYSSYYSYQKYEKRGEQDWIPCYPNTFSISGDSTITMPLSCKTENDVACGYIPVIEPQYRWNVVEGFMCANCDPTKVMIHTSADTIYISGSGEITQSEVSGYTSAATDIVITNDATSIGNNTFSGFTNVDFVRIPNTIISIGDKAFYGCEMMTECQIPYGVTTIRSYVFTNCTSLMFADIPNSVTTLGNGCFKNCLNFRYASIPSSITNIGHECFYNCDGLSDIEIPSSISSIGNYAFFGCSGLYSVTVEATTPPTLGTSAFTNTNTNLKIYVPCESLSTYKSASGWSAYANRIVPILNGCSVDAKFNAIYNNGENYVGLCNSNTTLTTTDTKPSGYAYSAMTSAVIGDCVTSIGNYAFSGCTSLTSITIPNSVTSIGSSAFADCNGLTSIDIPNSVTTIGSHAFEFCTSLTSCTIGSGVTNIGYADFLNCSGVTSIDIPNSVTYIDGYAFGYCNGLTSIVIPNSVTSIDNNAFFYCSGLTSCTIGSGVTSIGDSAFKLCTSLTSITVEATTPPTLGSDVFYLTNNCTIYVPAESLSAYQSTWSDYESRIQAIT